MELIRKHTNAQEPKIAFSTTNYHVFRAGIFATEQGIKAEGIGSKTKQYFFINAFVREFIATLVSEKKSHIKVMAVMLFIMFSSVATVYLCNIRWFGLLLCDCKKPLYPGVFESKFVPAFFLFREYLYYLLTIKNSILPMCGKRLSLHRHNWIHITKISSNWTLCPFVWDFFFFGTLFRQVF